MSVEPVRFEHISMRRPGPRMCTMNMHVYTVPSAAVIVTVIV